MLVLPVALGAREYVLIIVMRKENIARIKDHDPAEVIPAKLGGQWAGMAVRAIHIAYATEPEARDLVECVRRGDLMGALGMLRKGWKFRPDLGDSDGPYTPLVGEWPTH